MDVSYGTITADMLTIYILCCMAESYKEIIQTPYFTHSYGCRIVDCITVKLDRRPAKFCIP